MSRKFIAGLLLSGTLAAGCATPSSPEKVTEYTVDTTSDKIDVLPGDSI